MTTINEKLGTKARRPRMDPEIRALAAFVKALTRMSPNSQRAHLRWLVAKFGVEDSEPRT